MNVFIIMDQKKIPPGMSKSGGIKYNIGNSDKTEI